MVLKLNRKTRSIRSWVRKRQEMKMFSEVLQRGAVDCRMSHNMDVLISISIATGATLVVYFFVKCRRVLWKGVVSICLFAFAAYYRLGIHQFLAKYGYRFSVIVHISLVVFLASVCRVVIANDALRCVCKSVLVLLYGWVLVASVAILLRRVFHKKVERASLMIAFLALLFSATWQPLTLSLRRIAFSLVAEHNTKLAERVLRDGDVDWDPRYNQLPFKFPACRTSDRMVIRGEGSVWVCIPDGVCLHNAIVYSPTNSLRGHPLFHHLQGPWYYYGEWYDEPLIR